MWGIAVKFLRGVCVATDVGQWDEAEWPPHPSRLFMAMAAAYFETRDTAVVQSDDPIRRALEWLEQQSAPVVFASDAATRTPVTVFVPVNDSKRADQLFEHQRSRQPRHFPTSVPTNDVVYFVWEDASPDTETFMALEQITAEVTRIGHSSSIVQVWVEQELDIGAIVAPENHRFQWRQTEDSNPGCYMRVVADAAGTLSLCESNVNLDAIDEYVGLNADIKAAKGKEKKRLKEQLAERFPDGMPPSVDPPSTLAVGYRKVGDPRIESPRSHFDDELMVLSVLEGPAVSLVSTLQISGAFRKRLHDAFPDRKSPPWLGGHAEDGGPAKRPHLAILPLPFVGGKHGDGHLLGVGLAFPRDIAVRDRAIAMRNVFEAIDEIGDIGIRLNLKSYRPLDNSDCQLVLGREERLSPPLSLRAESWTKPCSVWETVTPIVLDRFPKQDRSAQREAWQQEVAKIICTSCENIGLPAPCQVHPHHNAFVRGVPKARPQASGFPLLTGGTRRGHFQVHARIEFDQPVRGPVIVGAGRFVGYGFCRPNAQRCIQRRKPA